MSHLNDIVTLITELGVLISVIVPVFVSIRKLKNGIKCQLRSEMLRTYYRHAETKEIRQYEYENFMALYDAYTALKGNSFIEKVHEEAQTWKVTT